VLPDINFQNMQKPHKMLIKNSKMRGWEAQQSPPIPPTVGFKRLNAKSSAVERCVGGICWPSAAPVAGSPGGRTEAPWGGPLWRGEAGAAEATGLGKTTFNKRRGVTGPFFATARIGKISESRYIEKYLPGSFENFFIPHVLIWQDRFKSKGNCTTQSPILVGES